MMKFGKTFVKVEARKRNENALKKAYNMELFVFFIYLFMEKYILKCVNKLRRKILKMKLSGP